ncbi:T6SS phospholipase effector Tle1-like catalytic domain-containing protein [Pseudarthrobacter sp. S9]|uniref:T6SS phospholipase effector Tle1-like catalytic domain-containing protein n=1 Tax=Pseudarthrobacter sp. S9 TaxID=3418421 RepID=UPI003D00A427
MSRNLVVCLDGTGGQLRAKGNTNVALLYSLLDHSDPAKQIAYYDPGVGTFASAGAWTPLARSISRLGGAAFGWGLRQNLGEAYTWLMQNWAAGDQVFIFGFSRGAYTARALVGILRAIGVLRPGSENLVPYVVATYARRGGEDKMDQKEIHLTSEVFAQHVDGTSTVPVKYLGVWDTVKAAGFLRWEIRWSYTRKLPNALRIRHAVSIHEQRAPFKEYLVQARRDGSLEEVWFAGVHSDVGGTFLDKPSAGQVTRPGSKTPAPRLSTIALKWIIEGGIAEGLLVRSRAVGAACAVTAADATAQLHRRGWAWVFLGRRNRKIPAGAFVHTSVKTRALTDPTFKAPDNVVWVDPGWVGRPQVPAQERSGP